MQLKVALSLASFIYAALAAPTGPSLSVKITSSDALKVVATVTNDGAEAVSVLKAGLFYAHPASVIQVTGPDGKTLPFEGLRPVLDVQNGGDALWATIPAGESYSTTLDLASSFPFAALGEHKVEASSFVQVLIGDKEELVPYSVSTTVSFPDGPSAAAVGTTFAARSRNIGKVSKRSPAVVDQNCAGWKYDQARQALWDALGLAYQAGGRVPQLEPTYWSFFKTAENAPFVAGKFNDIGSTAGTSSCVGNPSCVIRVTCVDNIGACSGGAVAVSTGDVIYPCDSFWNYPAAGTCANLAWGKADIFLHEISHSHAIGDIVYGLDGSRNLAPDQARVNADTYRYYARSIDSNCGW